MVVTSWGLIFSLLLSSGGGSNDLVSWFEAEAYFKSRQIEVKTLKMMELAGKEPKDAKTQIAQLLAIRWLGEHPDEVKKEKSARSLLKEIANEKGGKDPQGFAKDYSLAALAGLDGRTAPSRKLPENSVRSDALNWFPADPANFGVLDFRKAGELLPLDEKVLRKLANRAIPPQYMEEVYKFAEQVGNVRIDRFAFADSPDPNQQNQGRIYVRFTGAAERQRLGEFLAKIIPGANRKDEKGPRGEPITLISPGKDAPAIAIIGDSDVVLAGYDTSKGDNLQLVKDVLKIRAGGSPSLAEGGKAAVLKEILPLASGLFVWQPSLPLRAVGADILGGIPFTAQPEKFVIVLNKKKNLEIRIKTYMANKEDAKGSVENLNHAKETAIEGLKGFLKELKVKKETVDLLIQTVERIKIDAKESIITAEADVPPELLKSVGELIDLLAPPK